jgi:hypothetical protein
MSIARLALLALLTVGGCTNANRMMPPPGGEEDDMGTRRPEDGGGVVTCDNCGANQVCSNGTCTDVPKMCPCPIETYCDLASSTCKVGCVEDAQCSTGRICDSTARMCHEGCRKDAQCAAGKICELNACIPGCRMDDDCPSGQICDAMSCHAGCRKDGDCPAKQICDKDSCRAGCRKDLDCGASGVLCDPGSLTCRSGCHMTSECQKEQVCDVAKLTCVAGCDGDARCNAGRICEMGMCRAGCRMSSSCPLDQYCDSTGTKTCVAGCAAQDASNCTPGKACTSFVNGTYKCDVYCSSVSPCAAQYDCFESCPGDWSSISCSSADTQAARCRQPCTTDTECGAGYVCTWFSRNRSVIGGSWAEKRCAKKCTTTGDYCPSGAKLSSGQTGSCACDMPSGLCKLSGSACMITDPSAGK